MRYLQARHTFYLAEISFISHLMAINLAPILVLCNMVYWSLNWFTHVSKSFELEFETLDAYF